MSILTRTGLRAALVALVISSWWTSASAQSSLTPAGHVDSEPRNGQLQRR